MIVTPHTAMCLSTVMHHGKEHKFTKAYRGMWDDENFVGRTGIRETSSGGTGMKKRHLQDAHAH